MRRSLSGPNRERGRDEAGLLTTELAILMPIMLLIALVAVFAVDVERHASRAQQAADAAARAASMQRNESDALTAAQAAAEAVCHGSVSIDPIDFKPPEPKTFTPGRVGITLSCYERFSGFEPLVNDRTHQKQAQAVAAIEYWKSAP